MRVLTSLALVLLVATGCGDDTTTTDTGVDSSTDSSADSTPGDSAPMDSAADTSTDSGPTDAGDAGDAGDTGTGTPQSRITAILLPGATVTAPVVDESSAPLLLTTSAAFDHDTTAGESLLASDGPGRRISTTFTGLDVSFGPATAWVEGGGTALDPDLLFAGALGAGPQVLLGTFGSDARLYDFTADQFGPPVALVKTGGPAFTPISATTVNVVGTGAAIVALEAATPNLFVFNTTSGEFDPIPTAPVTCSAGTAIVAEHIVGALIMGFTPPGGADSVILIDGSDAYVLQSIAPFCFSDAFPILDASGAALTPEQAYGFDYDGDGDDDLVLIDTITVP